MKWLKRIFKKNKAAVQLPPKPSNIATTLFRHKVDEIITVEFLETCACYDTARETMVTLAVKPGKYTMTKQQLSPELPGQAATYWFLFHESTVGITEASLTALFKSGKARKVS